MKGIAKEIKLVTIIKKRTKNEKIKEVLSSLNYKEKLLNAAKYSGKIKLKKNPLALQKQLRNEWN